VAKNAKWHRLWGNNRPYTEFKPYFGGKYFCLHYWSSDAAKITPYSIIREHLLLFFSYAPVALSAWLGVLGPRLASCWLPCRDFAALRVYSWHTGDSA